MANYTYINGDFSVLKTILENTGLFDSIEYGSFSTGGWTYNNSLICSADGLTGFFKYGTGDGRYGLAVNQGRTPSYEFVPNYQGGRADDYFPIAAYVTANGISIVCKYARILIAKNQNGKVVVVNGANNTISTSTTDYIMGTISAIATTDDSELAAFPMQTAVEGQTLLVPICTQASFVSYTDKAALLAHKQYNIIGDITYDNKRYFTDGYFAIEDGEAAT